MVEPATSFRGEKGDTGEGIVDVSLNSNNAFVITLENGTIITTDTISASRLYQHTIYFYTVDDNNNYYRSYFTIIDDRNTPYTHASQIYDKYKRENENETCYFEASGSFIDALSQIKDICAIKIVKDVNVFRAEGVQSNEDVILTRIVDGVLYDDVVPLSLAVAKAAATESMTFEIVPYGE